MEAVDVSVQYGVATAWAPASLSNLGPGFDVLGAAVTGLGDRVTVQLRESSAIVVRSIGPEWLDGLPLNPELNTASVAVRRVLKLCDVEHGAVITIHKGIPVGSGIGGSAASAVGGAVAANAAIGGKLTLDQLASCALAGERVASGAIHGDNVIPSLAGGLCLTDPANPSDFRSLSCLEGLDIILLLPPVKLMTKGARSMLPDSVRTSASVSQSYRLAAMLDALAANDWAAAGRAMMSDDLAEPARAAQVPGFDQIRAAALKAGAFACALSGSGPAIFSLSVPGEVDSLDIGRAMLGAVPHTQNTTRDQHPLARVVCTTVDRLGARII